MAVQVTEQASLTQLDASIQSTKSQLTQITTQSAALGQQIADLLQQQEDQIIANAMSAGSAP